MIITAGTAEIYVHVALISIIPCLFTEKYMEIKIYALLYMGGYVCIHMHE
jgi:hypothetical protein